MMRSVHPAARAGAAVFLFCLFAAGLNAQSEKAVLVGTITDSTGALVPGVQVTATHVATGVSRTAPSGESGSYTIPLLEPGSYDIAVRKEGFRSMSRAGIPLHVNQTVRVDFVLEVGALSESVQVTAAAALLQSATSDLGHVVENRQVLDLPLNGRNTIALAVLAPGVRPQGTFGANPATVNYTGWGNFSANGGISNANEILVEGAPATTAALNGVVFMPPVDATEEFKVQTNNFSAEFDRTSGGVINLSLKSGTNVPHGALYEFLRNDKLDANDFFSNRAGRKVPVLRYNQLGGSAGGPIRKDKTFVFGLYEGFRLRQGRVLTTTVPAPQERALDFSQTRNASGVVRTLYDPLTTRRTADGRAYERTPFAGNALPSARLDPVSAKLGQYLWPLPNSAGAPFTNADNYATSSSQATNEDQITVKLDHHFGPNHRLSGSYSYSFYDLGGWDPFHNKTTLADDGRAEKNRTQFLTLNDSYVLRPTTILDIRASFSRFRDERLPLSFGQDLTALGFSPALANAVQWKHIPNIHVSGLANFATSTGSVIYGVQNNYALGGSLNLVRGGHSTKVGTLYRVFQLNRVQSNQASGDFTFGEGFTRADPLTASQTSGFGFATFLLGYADGGSAQKVSRQAMQSKYISWYLQDDWRITAKLTLNLGLRYSIEPCWTERYNHLSRFDPDATPALAAKYTGLPLRGGMVFMSPNDRAPADTYYRELAPRFGLAYTPFSKTVFRGGYGVFWLPSNVAVTNGNFNNPAYSVNTPFVSSLDGGLTPADRLNNPFPKGLLNPPGSASGADTLVGQGITTWSRAGRAGYAQQWNFDIQQELRGGLALDAAYAGSKGTDLPQSLSLNQLPNQYLALGTALNQTVPNPFSGLSLITTGTLSAATVTRRQLLLPYPQFTGVTLGNSAPIGNSTYHALQAKVAKRFSAAGTVIGSYTLSKSITDTESKTSWLEPGGQGGSYLDAYNRRLEKALANFDVTHRLAVSYNYQLPLGRGQAMLGGVRGVPGILVSGWQINGITTLQSGFPVVAGRPNVIGDPRLSGPESARLNRWFNTAAFAPVPSFTIANAPRTLPSMRSDGTSNFDFSVFKNTRMMERYTLQFRAEYFNLFNHVTFGRPDSSFGSSQYGRVSYAVNLPRQIQFALKLMF